MVEFAGGVGRGIGKATKSQKLAGPIKISHYFRRFFTWSLLRQTFVSFLRSLVE